MGCFGKTLFLGYSIGLFKNYKKKMWNEELQNGGRDYRLGIKVPIFMQKMGLKDVDIRINDYVEFISPLSDEPEYKAQIDSVLQSNGLENEGITRDGEVFSLNARSLVISYGTK